MSAGHPLLNRGLLAGTGAVLVVGGAGLVLAGLRPSWSDPLWNQWMDLRTEVWPRWRSATLELPGGISLPAVATAVIASATVLSLLLIWFLLTARRSTTRTVLQDRTATGTTTVDQRVVQAVLADPVSEHSDVAAAAVRIHRDKAGPAVELTVRVRPRADLGSVVASVHEAVRGWDVLADRQLPVVVRLARRPVTRPGAAARVS